MDDDAEFKKWQTTLDFKAKDLAFNAHFHSMSHFFSAQKYKIIHSIMKYGILILDIGVGAAAAYAGTFGDAKSPKAAKISLLALFATATLNGTKAFVDGSEFSPKKMYDLHYKAACRKKLLAAKVEAWSDAELNKGNPDGKMLGTYNEFSDELYKIEEKCIPTEYSTYKNVHEQLSPKWKEMGKRLRKYVPKNKQVQQ